VNLTRRGLLAPLGAGLLIRDRMALAYSEWNPFDGITNLVSWFEKLNKQFDQLVASEQVGQLSRSIDRLRKDLYQLEADTQWLMDRIPDEPPDSKKKIQLRKSVDILMKTVLRLTDSVRAIGAELRLREADEIEARLTAGLYSRGQVLTFLDARLQDQARWGWDAAELRGQLKRGLAAVKDAQLAATTFSQQLTRK
jgi:hypothetical protein